VIAEKLFMENINNCYLQMIPYHFLRVKQMPPLLLLTTYL